MVSSRSKAVTANPRSSSPVAMDSPARPAVSLDTVSPALLRSSLVERLPVMVSRPAVHLPDTGSPRPAELLPVTASSPAVRRPVMVSSLVVRLPEWAVNPATGSSPARPADTLVSRAERLVVTPVSPVRPADIRDSPALLADTRGSPVTVSRPRVASAACPATAVRCRWEWASPAAPG